MKGLAFALEQFTSLDMLGRISPQGISLDLAALESSCYDSPFIAIYAYCVVEGEKKWGGEGACTND